MQLIPMTEAELADYLQRLIPDYAAEHVRAGNWTAEEAETRAAAQIREFLPDGVATPDHYLYTLHAGSVNGSVGLIWFAVMRHGPKPRGFIYDIVIHPELRRQGYGAQAMRAIEETARELGIDSISLHVFGHNSAARALYDQLGYRVTDLWMKKDLQTLED